MSNTNRGNRDVALALNYACNVQAHEMVFGGSGQDTQLKRGTEWEPRLVDRYQETVEMYSRLLLVRLRARIDRLTALEAECRRRAANASLGRALFGVLRRLASVHRDPGEVLSSLRWVLAVGRRRRFRRAHMIAAGLAADARTIVIQAGAARDPVTRTRLLTATRYQAARDVLDFSLGDPSLAGPPDRLLAELDWLDNYPPRREGR
ncbi:hypothetical protein [Thermostaphylospora chromogena]|uniref:Uncharacterized protein n=1 Tax=Thermostaphylospora chromogena TaxID=35622 RepID=A0A1H1CC70_9ACTN|nr:hypothetical protein [Thermostaphylospora chromogena]SDQ61785.1 hypothetical protein SAMN04489764_1404 [Thermostaphylospora chromogena]